MATSDVREAFEAWWGEERGTQYACRAVAWDAWQSAHRAGKVAGLREAYREARDACRPKMRRVRVPTGGTGVRLFPNTPEDCAELIDALAAKEEA